MSVARALLLCGLAWLAPACMDHQSRVESVPHQRAVQVGQPLRSTRRAYAVLRDAPDGLIAEARMQADCPTRELTLMRDVNVTEITAAQSRWYAAAPCFVLGGTLLTLGREARPYAYVAVAAGAAVAGFPMLGERTKREHRAWREQVTSSALVPCADRPLSEVTLTLRSSAGTREGVTDAAGRVAFPGVSATQVRVVYFDDVAVPIYRPGLTPPPR